MEEKKYLSNYVKQANFLTTSVFLNMTEVQKDGLYFIMQNIDYHSLEPQRKITIDFKRFLEYKGISKNNFYSIAETEKFLNDIVNAKGSFFNKFTGEALVFSLIDNVKINTNNPNELDVTLGDYGQTFLYEKLLEKYINSFSHLLPKANSGTGYTQIEKNVVSLDSYQQKKLFEILSRWKNKGFYRTSILNLKLILGLVEFKIVNGDKPINSEHQLRLLFGSDSQDYIKIEKYEKFSDFRKFLERACKTIESNPKLDINNLSFKFIKSGKKVTHLEFSFKKYLNNENLSADESKCKDYLISFGLSETQVFLLLNKIGHVTIYSKLSSKIRYEKDKLKGYKYFDRETNKEINNLAGFLYTNVFGDYLKD